MGGGQIDRVGHASAVAEAGNGYVWGCIILSAFKRLKISIIKTILCALYFFFFLTEGEGAQTDEGLDLRTLRPGPESKSRCLTYLATQAPGGRHFLLLPQVSLLLDETLNHQASC